MKVVIDAMGTEFGGIRTYIDELLAAWASTFPDDELHVLVPEGSTVGAQHVPHAVPVSRPGIVTRPLVQTRALRRLVRETGADAVLAAMPATSLRRVGAPLTVVVHDLRHDLRPEQFTRGRRLVRRLSYRRTYRLADGFVSVSRRTLDDLHSCYPATASTAAAVVHHGADHVRRWAAEPHRGGPAIAFAHHTNKNPDLIIAAWSELADRGDARALTIVGVGSRDRERLQDDIRRRGLEASVELAPFLSDDDFGRAIAGAHLVVFPSDFEGFGLPVVEAMALGKPVVIGPERATLEVAGGHATVMADWSAAALADAVQVAAARDDADLAAARDWAATFTWERAARQTREALG